MNKVRVVHRTGPKLDHETVVQYIYRIFRVRLDSRYAIWLDEVGIPYTLELPNDVFGDDYICFENEMDVIAFKLKFGL